MDTLVNLSLLIVGFAGAIIAIGGDTWHKGTEPVLQRITKRGWLSIVALSLTTMLGVIKEFRAAETAEVAAMELKRAEASRKELQEQLQETSVQFIKSQRSLESANQKLEKAQISLSAIEPDLLEGMFQLTERIPREQDFAFANVNGSTEVIPISSETQKQLFLYGGDVFEWHHFCNYPSNASLRNGLLDSAINNRRLREPFILDTGYRSYLIDDKQGEIRISGPIGVPMKAVIRNPTRYKNCGFKIVVRSTDRTRTKSQFEPLLRKIRDAKAALK